MKVNYSLQSKDLNSVSSEAAWAERMGYDSISSNETAHDPFLPLVLAATSTNHINLQTHVAIALEANASGAEALTKVMLL